MLFFHFLSSFLDNLLLIPSSISLSRFTVSMRAICMDICSHIIIHPKSNIETINAKHYADSRDWPYLSVKPSTSSINSSSFEVIRKGNTLINYKDEARPVWPDWKCSSLFPLGTSCIQHAIKALWSKCAVWLDSGFKSKTK